MTQARRLELFRRYLDRELDARGTRELERLLAGDAGARAELETYRSLLAELAGSAAPEPPVDFAARVMRNLPAAPRRSWWREVVFVPRLSLGALVALVALGVLVWLSSSRLRPAPIAPAPPPGIAPSRIMVRFVLPARGAHRVALAGDFNGWRTDDVALVDERGDGVFSATIALPPGRTSYLFWVDGRWVQDPAAPSIPDGFGQQNSVLDL